MRSTAHLQFITAAFFIDMRGQISLSRWCWQRLDIFIVRGKRFNFGTLRVPQTGFFPETL